MALPISKPLKRGGFLARSNGERSWVSFKYERLPMFCHFYGILGHDLKHCAAHYVAEKNGGNIQYQYGDFLRATSGRAKVSINQHTSPKSFTKEGACSGSIQDPVPMVQILRTVAAARKP